MKRMTEKIIKTVLKLQAEGHKINAQKIYEIIFLMHGKILFEGVRQELLDRKLFSKAELDDKESS